MIFVTGLHQNMPQAQMRV